MKRNLGRKGIFVKECISDLQAKYDLFLNPLVGGKGSKDSSPSAQSKAGFEMVLPLLIEAFHQVQHAYQILVEKRHALDFDDLESGAQLLLRQSEIRKRWQGELDAVLVDEFQDTNQRQLEIVKALVGKPGGLFIVGDRRQSIYRFRNADVTVFREVQEGIKQQGGLLIDLNRTYRAHEALLLATIELLSSVIGTEEDATRKYFVPYTPLIADVKESPEHIFSPHIEFVLGAGANAQSARPLAAVALAERLHQLKNEGQIKRWDDVTLLFRASTGFPFYEEAFEDARILFVTVAGRGFYDRPEIRDLVNILRGLADPFDDLSFAGLLRSPAFGLSDTALYLLRQDSQSYWNALLGDLSLLSEIDQRNVSRRRQIISVLFPLVDRIPVAELLKQIVDEVNYHAILATADLKSGDNDSRKAGGVVDPEEEVDIFAGI